MQDEDKKVEEVQTDSSEQINSDKAQEYLENWKRERADFLNYKKDEARRIEQFVKFGNEDLVLEMLEVMDTLELALQSFPLRQDSGQADKKEIKEWLAGLESIMKQSQELFKKYGVEKIEVEGQKFNPELHEAVETEQGGEKMVQVRSGYTMHGKVIRPARVKIIK